MSGFQAAGGHRVLIAGGDAAGAPLALELADAGLPVAVCTRGAVAARVQRQRKKRLNSTSN